MEKSKTTPDAYPMTYLSLTTGCNQKSNRDPINNYSQDQIEESADQLREMGAVALIQGNGRVPKVRHYGYQWLGISKTEAAVMTELLLRGHQTLGELRTRASRMEPIADLPTLQKILHELHDRRLVIFLSPEGRGQVVSHNLYQDHELQQLKSVANHMATHAAEASEPVLQPARTSSQAAGSSVAAVNASEHRSSSTGGASLTTANAVSSANVASHTPTNSQTAEVPSALVQEMALAIVELQETVKNLADRLGYLEVQLGVKPE